MMIMNINPVKLRLVAYSHHQEEVYKVAWMKTEGQYIIYINSRRSNNTKDSS